MQIALALHDWGEIGELVLAGTAIVALVFAWLELRSSRVAARRERVYAYQEQVNQRAFREESVSYREYWEAHTFEDYKKLTRLQRNEMLMIPNLMEEIAALYNRKLLDRDVAAETLGIYVERLWTASMSFVHGLRANNGPPLYGEWEEMQRDTPGRKLRVDRKLARRRAWRKLRRGI
jgi:hypothetical protein